MRHLFHAGGLAFFAAFGVAVATHAAPVTFTHDYGTGAGQVAPNYGGAGNMFTNYVRVEDKHDTAGNRFYDEIDFGGFDTIDSLTLTLSIADARATVWGIPIEDWRVYGSTNGATSPTDRVQLGSRLGSGSTWTYTLEAGSVFDQAISSGTFAFWFGNEGLHGNDFKLFSATLTVDGAVAPIPLPAAGLLLIGSLGGFALLRRRGTEASAA